MSIWRLCFWAIVVALLCSPAAADPTTSISQLRSTRWLAREGAPANIQHIAQSPDGFLWLAAPDGLTRFDGVKFEVFPPVDDGKSAIGPIRVLATRSGEIWGSYDVYKGVSIFKNGRFVNAGMPHPAIQVTELFEDQKGTIWAVNARPTRAVSRFREGRWEELGPEWGVPDGWIFSAVAARDGSIWLATMDKLAVLPSGGARFLPTPAQVTEGAGLAEDAAGRMWISDRLGTRRLPDYVHGQTDDRREPHYPPIPNMKRAHITFASDGSLWGVTGSQGVFRIEDPAHNGGFSRFTEADGLTDDGTLGVLADREGTVWISGERGLNAFVATGIAPEDRIASKTAGKYHIAKSTEGTVYAAKADTLYIIPPNSPPRRIRTGIADLQAICSDRRNGVWIIRSAVIERLVGARTVQTADVGGHKETFACGVDRDGRLWLTGADHQLAMRDSAGWRDQSARLPAGSGGAVDVMIDRAGRVLVVDLEHRSLTRIDGTASTTWNEARMAVGRISIVQDSAIGLLVGGFGGMARIRDQSLQRLDARRFPVLRTIRAIAEGPDGQIWMFSSKGLTRIAATDLDHAFDHPDQPLAYRRFTELDGVRTLAQRTDGLQAVAGPDGRLWFLGNRGVTRVQPAAMEPNLLPPPVVIRSITADSRSFGADGPVVLPAGTRNLAMAYTALSLRTPERVAFRYRLDGVDKDWINAGGRRDAFYTNLAPGKHRFTVIAANDDGVWNPTGATVDFEIPPTFTQSPIFLVLVGLVILGLTWLFFTWRLRTVSGRIRARMSERIAERERIARELHDTLLQGVQALILRFQVIADDVPMRQPARRAIEQALDAADDMLAQARDRVRELRASGPGGDFTSEVDRLIQGLGFDPDVSVSHETVGAPEPLDPRVSGEVVKIVGEALFNALRHARPTKVVVRTEFRLLSLSVSVTDDGCGCDPDLLQHGRPGHFGLAGMRERANRLRARLVIESANGGGTKVMIVVPGGVAYAAGVLDRLVARWRPSGA